MYANGRKLTSRGGSRSHRHFCEASPSQRPRKSSTLVWDMVCVIGMAFKGYYFCYFFLLVFFFSFQLEGEGGVGLEGEEGGLGLGGGGFCEGLT